MKHTYIYNILPTNSPFTRIVYFSALFLKYLRLDKDILWRWVKGVFFNDPVGGKRIFVVGIPDGTIVVHLVDKREGETVVNCLMIGFVVSEHIGFLVTPLFEGGRIGCFVGFDEGRLVGVLIGRRVGFFTGVIMIGRLVGFLIFLTRDIF